MNVELLNQKIDESGIKKNKVAETLHCAPATLSQKLKGKCDFKVEEVIALQQLLHLNGNDIADIFFKERK